MRQMRTTYGRHESRERRNACEGFHLLLGYINNDVGWARHMFFADPVHALQGRDVQRIHKRRTGCLQGVGEDGVGAPLCE